MFIVVVGALGVLFGFAGTAAADLVTPNSAEQPVSSSLDGSPPKPIESASEEEGSSEEGMAGAPVATEDATPVADAEGADAAAADAEPVPEEGAPAPAQAAVPAATPLAPPPIYTPVPETVIERATPVSALQAAEAGEPEAASLGIVDRARRGMDEAGAVLRQVVHACQVGVGQASGGPLAALAVLSMVTALERRRALWARLATDEDPPEFLYAWDVIAPG